MNNPGKNHRDRHLRIANFQTNILATLLQDQLCQSFG